MQQEVMKYTTVLKRYNACLDKVLVLAASYIDFLYYSYTTTVPRRMLIYVGPSEDATRYDKDLKVVLLQKTYRGTLYSMHDEKVILNHFTNIVVYSEADQNEKQVKIQQELSDDTLRED